MHVTASTPPAMAGKCIRIRQTGKGQGPHPGDPAAPPCVGGIPISLSRVSHPLAPPAPPSIYSQPHHYSVLRGYAEGARIVLGVSVRIVLGGVRAYCSGRDNSAYCSREGVRALCAMASVRIVLERQRRHARVVATTRRPETTPQGPRALAQTGRPARLLLLDRARLRPRLGIRHAAWRRCLLHYTPKR